MTDEIDDTAFCERCGSECEHMAYSCHPISNHEALEKAGMDPILCDECLRLFVSIYHVDGDLACQALDKNIGYRERCSSS